MIQCSLCGQGLNLTKYCEHWKGEKLKEEEIKWVIKCEEEGQIYMIGVNHEVIEQIMKKGRKIKNRLMKFGQLKKEEIKERKWETDWNEEEERKKIERAIKEYEKWNPIKTPFTLPGQTE